MNLGLKVYLQYRWCPTDTFFIGDTELWEDLQVIRSTVYYYERKMFFFVMAYVHKIVKRLNSQDRLPSIILGLFILRDLV